VKYLVALLNSRLLRFVYTETVRESQQKAFPQVKLAALRGLPMRKIDLAKPSDKLNHDALVRLVDNALAIQKRLAAEKNPLRKEALQRNFETIDAEIETRVYALYELSEADISIIESTLAALAEPDKPTSWRPTPASPILNPVKSAAKPVGGPRSARRQAPAASKPKRSSSKN
jgi:hypothetical protein